MDIECDTAPWNWRNVFRPIQQFPLNQLQQQKVVIQNSFASTPNDNPVRVVLSLTRQFMILSAGNTSHLTPIAAHLAPIAAHLAPIAALVLNFDLKFQVLHQIQNNLSSAKIGINFYEEENKGCAFYANQSTVDAWLKCLSLRLHQKGFHQRFKPLRKLGKGNFATVYEVQRFSDKKKFAVKAFSKQTCFAANRGKQSLINQLKVMRQLSEEAHKNLLRLEGVFQSSNSIYIVLDLLSGGQLFHRIQERNGHFTSSQVRECMYGLVSGLAHMHSRRIMHRDLKPENIMLRDISSMQPVIVDFGLATNVDVKKYLFYRCGTPGYVAPEIIALAENGHVNPECDIFSIGVIFHIFLTRKPLFQGSKYDQVYRNNKEMKFSLEGERYQDIDAQAMDLLRRMLTADPAQRITAALCLQHPYFVNNYQDEVKIGSPCVTSLSTKLKKLAH